MINFAVNRLQKVLLFATITLFNYGSIHLGGTDICQEFAVFVEKEEWAATQSATPTERQDAAGLQTSKKSKSKPQQVVLKKFTSAHVASVQAKLTEHKLTCFPLSPSF